MVKVFLSYSRADIEAASRIYARLREEKGVDPWFDKRSLLPGLKWKPAIRKAIREADFFIALISSRSTSKRGYVHSELKMAIEVLKEFPEDEIFLIPVRLDECEMPTEDLREINYVDLFDRWEEGVEGILTVIRSKILKNHTSEHSSGKSASTPPPVPSAYHYRVGISDMDIGLSNIMAIAQRLNSVQSYFHFTCPALPKLSDAVSVFGGFPNFDVHRVPVTFYSEHPYLAVDLLACLTRYPLAFREGDSTLYNYFSGPGEKDGRFLFISTYNLYEYSKTAGCSFEKGVLYIIVGQLVAYFTDLDYHDQTQGCVMDFCQTRADLVIGLRQPKFCDRCDRAIQNQELKAALNALLADDPKL